jgi:NADH-quinone oxidoreductase subunit G
MVKIFIDERELEVAEGTTILKAAESAGLQIPHLCYHKAFMPEGSCRMCLVEIEGIPKLELACSTQVREGMKISTKSERVTEARKGVLECLLAEHPIDCPICDKAGECKLQDYYEEYGLFDSEFNEYKEKRQKRIEIGKNLLHDQERCVLCRRCVRFLKEVTKTEELGVFQRGIHAEVRFVLSERSRIKISGLKPEPGFCKAARPFVLFAAEDATSLWSRIKDSLGFLFLRGYTGYEREKTR